MSASGRARYSRCDTAATMAVRAADPRSFDAYRTTEGLRTAGLLTLVLASGMTPGDALAAQYAADEARRAAAMAFLEARGWNPVTARAATHGRTSGSLADAIRTVIDGEGWSGARSCSDCWQNHPDPRCGCPCHGIDSRALAVQGTGTAAAA